MFPLLQSTAGQKIPVILKDAAGAVVTGVESPTITLDKAGAGLGAVHDGTWSEAAGGLYWIQLDDTDTDTVGALVARVVKAGCVDSFVCCSVRATTEAAVKVSVGTGAGQLDVSGGKAPATIASGDAVGLPAAAAGAKGGLPILDAATGIILTGYGPAAATITAGVIATDAITAGAVKADAVTKIQAGLSLATELAKVKGAVGGKIVVSADGLTVEKYDAAGNLLVTLVRTGTGPYTWTPTWA